MDMLHAACHFLMLSHELTWFMDVVSAHTTPRASIANIVRISTMTSHGNQLLASRQMLVKVRVITCNHA
jgi:hypothetical protein